MKNNTATVKRHSFLYRCLHWLIVTEMLLLLLSGLNLSEYLDFDFISRGASRNLHIVAGLAWISTTTFFLYYFIMSGEYKWFGLSKIGHAFDFFVHEAKNCIEGNKVKSPVAYGIKKKQYVEKVVPTAILAWWGWFGLWTVMAFTGLAILFPGNFNTINSLCHGILPSFGKAAAATRLIHMSASMAIVIYMFIHAYATWTFGLTGSMISGTREEPVVDPDREEFNPFARQGNGMRRTPAPFPKWDQGTPPPWKEAEEDDPSHPSV
ncbi:MAG: cytochrome b/b6 domain-containing protein [Desulfobacteraceae bacterium]|nr:cytochrome b/b6 domain-containing protein [Desulfobacteraceae bacterium]